MKYESKILRGFMSVALIAVVIGATATYSVLSYRAEKDFIFQSQSKVQIVAKSLQAFERQADLIAQNAVKALSEIEHNSGLPSDKELATISRSLNISNIFITNKDGRFIRSTNGKIEDFKNGLFDYCAGYKGLIDGSSLIEQTPIIPSSDEAISGPFKYTMYPNKNKTRVLEVSVHLDYIAKTLSDFIHSDPGVKSVGLYTPTGESLGTLRASQNNISADNSKLDLNDLKKETVRHENGTYYFHETVNATIAQCCECKTKGVVRPGEDYYYALKTGISDAALVKAKTDLLWVVAGAGALILLIAYWLARRLSVSLARRIRLIESAISRIIETKQLSERLNINGEDELSKMGQHFDKLLGALETAQENLLAAKSSEVTNKVAHDVAHNIKGPLAALDALLQMSPELADHRRKVIQDCIKDIKKISQQLLSPTYVASNKSISSKENLNPIEIIENAVAQKKVQYGGLPGLRFVVSNRNSLKNIKVNIAEHELKTVISNIVDNAIIATQNSNDPQILVELMGDDLSLNIVVHDNGAGFPKEVLDQPGTRGLTTRKLEGGNGLGLAHAFETAKLNGDDIYLSKSQMLDGACVKYIAKV